MRKESSKANTGNLRYSSVLSMEIERKMALIPTLSLWLQETQKGDSTAGAVALLSLRTNGFSQLPIATARKVTLHGLEHTTLELKGSLWTLQSATLMTNTFGHDTTMLFVD
mmetsp:Transcript_12793/g.17134  ORF Transcript_12793/g.17134 Transcript_12793/m.17134 type:complete len:111 (+) Transcript_12793:312-644(+)